VPPDPSSRGCSRTLKDLPAADGLLPKLGRYTEGVGCIYAEKLEDIDLDVLRRLIAIAWARGDDPNRRRPSDAIIATVDSYPHAPGRHHGHLCGRHDRHLPG
jgi:hypothetical protein